MTDHNPISSGDPTPRSAFRGGELKQRVARGVAWSMAEKIGSTLLQIGVSLTLLRLLTREDLGIMAILTAASAIALVIVDSGFSQMLIRQQTPRREDFKSVFVFNIAVSVVLYLLLAGLSPLAADYYAMPRLDELAPVFFLLLPLNALSTVQNAVLVREFRFALLSQVTFVAALVSGGVAIGMALGGCGVWSIVAQRVLQMGVRSAALWGFSRWRPDGRFEAVALRRMAPYSLSLMATDLISTFYNKIPQFFLGRLYTAETLGAFDQAVKLKDQPVTSTMQAVQGVIFPALSKIGDDAARFAESYRQLVMMVCYLLVPLMAGLSAVGHDLFAALLGEEWMPTVPYFEVVCLAGFFYPVAQVAFNVLKVKCGGGVIIRIEVIKKVLMTLIFALTIPRSVEAVVWGLVAIAFMEMAVNVGASLRFTTLSVGRLVRTLLPILAVTGAMYAAVRWGGELLPEGAFVRLFGRIAIGMATYLLLSLLFRLEALGEILALVRRQMVR